MDTAPSTGTTFLSSYRIVKLDSLDSLCYGIIGQGGTFCLKRDCKLQHKGGLHDLFNSGDIYVLKSSARAFSEPSLFSQDIEAGLLQQWLARSATLEEWRNLFMLVTAKPEAQAVNAPKMEQQEAQFEFAKSFRTPSKRVRGLSFDLEEQFTPHKRIIVDKTAFASSGQSVLDVVEVVEEHLSDAGQVLVSSIDTNNRSFHTQVQAIRAMDLRLNSAIATLGTMPGSLSTTFSAPTIWGVLAELASAMSEVSSSGDSVGPTSNATATLWAKIEKLDQAIGFPRSVGLTTPASLWEAIEQLTNGDGLHLSPSTMESLADIIKDGMSTKMQAMDSRHENLKTFVKSIVERLLTKLQTTQVVYQSLEARLRVLEQRAPSQSASQMSPPDAMEVDDDLLHMLGSPSASKPTPIDLVSRVNELEGHVRRLVAEASDSAVKFGSLGFRSIGEVRSWTIKHLAPRLPFGLFPDVYTILDCLYGSNASDTKLLQDLERSLKLKLESSAEAKAMLAFEHKLPLLLHKDKGTVTRKGESHLNQVPTYDDWWHDGVGLKDRLSDELPGVEQGFLSQIEDRLEAGTIAHSLATQAVTQAIAWIGDLTRFMDETYESLIRSGFSKISGWALTTKLVHRIFIDLHGARTGILQSFKPGDIESTCHHVLWGVFKTHDVMAEFKRHKFRNHPSISSEYVKFLASNSGNDLIDKVVLRVSALETTSKTHTSEITKANSTASVAQNKASEVKKALDDVDKRVRKLEQK